MSLRGRLRPLLLNTLFMLVIITVTLAIADVVLIATGLLPPAFDPGDARVGWLSARPTGTLRADRCIDLESGNSITFGRNEDGIRSDRPAAELVGPSPRLEVVVSGDSHTDLCATNSQTHAGYTEAALRQGGTESAFYANGSGKYSPLQAYLAIEPLIERYDPQAFILNLYTGNDFYDMMRVDDRPHLVPDGDGYRVADPVWYRHDPPESPPRSRVLFAGRRVLDAIGVRGLFLRVSYLRKAAAEQDASVGVVFRYMNDLRKSSASNVGYPQAFSAQMLNQQLFFHHFPGSLAESERRVEELLRIVRARHPDLVLVLSPIPSYQLVAEEPSDSSLIDVLAGLPIDFAHGVKEEQGLYERLRPMAERHGWVFVDNLSPLRAAPDREVLFNHFDYHLTPAASAIIGATQATALRPALGSPAGARR